MGVPNKNIQDAESRSEIIVLVTASSEEEATKIARSLVDTGLAACANILPGVKSIFRWQGKVLEETELLVILKTKADLRSNNYIVMKFRKSLPARL